LPTVLVLHPSRAPIALLFSPPAAASTIRQRSARARALSDAAPSAPAPAAPHRSTRPPQAAPSSTPIVAVVDDGLRQQQARACRLTTQVTSPALAGEVTGNGEPTGMRAHANSICGFSGQNDGNPPPGRTASHVQNWGQIPKEGPGGRDFLTSIGSNPGAACNGHLSPRK
jgi:hypothetical protein